MKCRVANRSPLRHVTRSVGTGCSYYHLVGVWARLKIVQQTVSSELVGARRTSADANIAHSVLRALVYSDLFDFPLNLVELTRYQIETDYTSEDIESTLGMSPDLGSKVSRSEGGFYCLRGREQVFKTRATREGASRRVWRRARRYAALMARFPFVRMVAVTGALAVNNIADRPDIDLLVVTEQGRVWIARRLIVLLVRFARLFRDDLCPNYIISDDSLSLDQRDLFTAHELAQMVPLAGDGIYTSMIKQNSWADKYLPAALGAAPRNLPDSRPGVLRRLAERLLRWHALDGWENWELERLRKKLRPLMGGEAEVVCSRHQCKGHTGLHRQWVTARYEERLRDYGLL